MTFGFSLVNPGWLHLCSKDDNEGTVSKCGTQNRSLRIFIWQAIVRRPSVSTEGLFYFLTRRAAAHSPQPHPQRSSNLDAFLLSRSLNPSHSPSSSPMSPFPGLSLFLHPLAFFRLFFSIFAAHLQAAPTNAATACKQGAIAQLVRAQDS